MENEAQAERFAGVGCHSGSSPSLSTNSPNGLTGARSGARWTGILDRPVRGGWTPGGGRNRQKSADVLNWCRGDVGSHPWIRPPRDFSQIHQNSVMAGGLAAGRWKCLIIPSGSHPGLKGKRNLPSRDRHSSFPGDSGGDPCVTSLNPQPPVSDEEILTFLSEEELEELKRKLKDSNRLRDELIRAFPDLEDTEVTYPEPGSPEEEELSLGDRYIRLTKLAIWRKASLPQPPGQQAAVAEESSLGQPPRTSSGSGGEHDESARPEKQLSAPEIRKHHNYSGRDLSAICVAVAC